MSKSSDIQLTKTALQSAQELDASQQSKQETWNGVEVLQNLLQALVSDPLGLPDLRPLLVYYDTACKCLKFKTTSATNAKASSVALQDCTGPTEQDIATIERMLVTYTFIVEIALALATVSSIADDTVLVAKSNLERRLEEVKRKIWNETEREHTTTERDTLEGNLATCEATSQLLLFSMNGGHAQEKEVAETAYRGLQAYLVHKRKEYPIIMHKLSQQDRLDKEKDCLNCCLTVCGQVLDSCSGTANPHKVETSYGHYWESSTPGGGRQVIGVQPGTSILCENVSAGDNSIQVLGSFDEEGLQRLLKRPSTVKSKSISRPQEKATVNRLEERGASMKTPSSAGVSFQNIQTGPGEYCIDVTTESGRFQGTFSNITAYENALADHVKGAAEQEFKNQGGLVSKENIAKVRDLRSAYFNKNTG